MKKILICFLFLLNASITMYGNNSEHIYYFHSDIVIDTTGRVEIKESITVYADGDDIQRGIVRSIPIFRKDNKGRKKNIDFTILSIQRNGNEEPFNTKIVGNNKEIFIGSSDAFLEPGMYKYTIVYETYGHIGFFDSYDELYWNITGNDWPFRIEKATATITLPESTSFINAACYTGAHGESNNDCSFLEQNGQYLFQAKSSLKPNEGFTVGIAFTPNIIKRPPPPTFWERVGSPLYIILSLLILGCYYVVSWRKVGKDPKKQIVVPTFDPPNGWSAATVRRLYKKEYDKKVLTVTLVEMAVNRLIRIRQESEKRLLKSPQYKLEKLATEETHMTSLENSIIKKLFSGDNTSIVVSNNEHATFAKVDQELKTALLPHDKNKTIRHNYKYVFFAAVLNFALLALYSYLFNSTNTLIITILTCLPTFIGSMLVVQALRRITFAKAIQLIVGIVFLATTLFLQQVFLLREDQLLAAFSLLTLISFQIYFVLIKAPTELSREIEAELKGFRMYLKTAEENRLNLLTPPERTPELFEKLLPYAIALDVENAWGEKFNQVLKQANYTPAWYEGTKSFYATDFMGSFSHTFNSSLQKAKIDPTSNSRSGNTSSGSSSWSSGSRGGGFSGGGGGGGGGRGW